MTEREKEREIVTQREDQREREGGQKGERERRRYGWTGRGLTERESVLFFSPDKKIMDPRGSLSQTAGV